MDADCDTAMEGEEQKMRTLKITSANICIALFLFCSLINVVSSFRTPVSDFGNYYYGAKLMGNTTFEPDFLYDVMFFNDYAERVGAGKLFLNYSTVSPQTALLYQPFGWIEGVQRAKSLFNWFSIVIFILVLHQFLRKFVPDPDWKVVLLLIAAMIPIYYNLLFGQTYLLITALLMLTILCADKFAWLSGFSLALAIALKISPAILLIWLFSERKYKVIGWTVAGWTLITCATALLTEGMAQEMIAFYTESFPRMTNGFVSDPFTSSFQGVVVFLRKLMLPDAILNPDSLFNGSERLVQLINTAFFVGISVVLIGAWKSTLEWRRKILLLLLLVNITSGYTSTYSLLLMVPFISFGNTTRDWIRLMLYAIVLMFPPRIFDGFSPFLEEYKLWIFIALFIMECKPYFSFTRVEKPQLLVGMIFFAMVIVKFSQRPEEMPLKYYRPDLVSQDYVLYALTADSALTYISYADGGFRQYHIPVNEDWRPGDQAMTKVHGVSIRKIGEDTDNLLVLSDYHRGPGLFHLYTISKSEFKSISGK